ncbi:LuxR C-terminal-related transcriptional regulator [Pseudarthrobacter sp. P1]|uniref:helix-turn-helix transcriptional regulator n=1 Tax=Pseudarthrobacter sp. P1 TaxID=3418418 RepID=UPI003CF8BBC6
MKSVEVHWPFTGHATAVGQIAQSLRGVDAPPGPGSAGVLLSGPSGVGKTYLANQALKELRAELLVMGLRVSPALATQPYGALTVLLSELDPETINHPVHVLAGLMALLQERAAGRGICLYVDNASELDELSAVVMAQLARSGTVRLLLTCADAVHLPRELADLAKDGLVREFTVAPLGFAEALAWMQAGLGATVSRQVARVLWTSSGGNPLFLRTLAGTLHEAGAMLLRDGVWVLAEEKLQHGSPAMELFATTLARLDPPGRRVVEIVALAEALPLGALLAVAGAQEVDGLEEAGLLRIDAAKSVHLDNQLFAATVRAHVPEGRSNELRLQVLAAADGTAARGVPGVHEVELACARWTLDCGAPLGRDTALAAARLANNNLDARLALRLVETIGAGADTAVATERIRALMTLGRPTEALSVLRSYQALQHPEPGLADWAGLMLAETSVLLTRPDGWPAAAAILAKVRGELYPSAGDPTVVPEGADAGLLREALVLAEAGAAAWTGAGTPELVQSLEAFYADSAAHAPCFRLLAGSHLCQLLAVQGAAVAAGTLADTLLARYNPPLVPVEVMLAAHGRIYYSYLLAGRWDEAAALMRRDEESLDTASLFDLYNSTELPQAVLVALRGWGPECLALLEPAISQLKVHDAGGALGLAHAAYAYACATSGRPAEAMEHLAAKERYTGTGEWVVERLGAYFCLMARGKALGADGPARELRELAAEDAAAGRGSAAVVSLSLAIRLGSTDAAGELLELLERAGGYDGGYAQVCAAYARGLLEQDPAQLAQAAAQAVQLGNDGFAIDAAEAALALAPGVLEKNRIRRLRALLEGARRRAGGTHPGAAAALPLTRREIQIGTLAAVGSANKDIARTLHISVRTVEGHLYQIFSKLRIAERSELSFALGVAGEDQ